VACKPLPMAQCANWPQADRDLRRRADEAELAGGSAWRCAGASLNSIKWQVSALFAAARLADRLDAALFDSSIDRET